MVNEGIALDAGLDSKASTYNNTSTEQEDGSSNSGYATDTERAQVDKVVSDKENSAVGPSLDNNTLTKVHLSNNDTFENMFPLEILNHKQPEVENSTKVNREAHFEKSIVKEIKDDLKYVLSLEDKFDENCLILDIQTEFLKTQFESTISESYRHMYENEMFDQNSSLESENRCFKKTVAQFQQDFSKLETHCINLELQLQNNVLKSGQHGQMLNETSNEAKIKTDIHVTESINLELECKVAKLLEENEHLKAQIQEKVFATAALKNEFRKSKGNSVDTKFSKPPILGKSPLQPLRNQSVVRQPNAFKSERPKLSKPRFASQVDVKNDLSKPITPHYWPNVREPAFIKPHHVIASSESKNSSKNMPRFSSNNMVHNHYLEEAKKKTQERDINSNTSVMPSARLPTTTNDAIVIRDFYKKFYNSLGRVPNRCSSIGKTRELLLFSRRIGWEGLIMV
ncbi:hypothetical protein Tco_0772323 [Tanacetum coccineum]|uniref:Uncharacterized protein n=1 Tax=Tanacetum coccineum TaxID=301880 RepID=A0ABQ4ZIN2_9ASTR